jgi:hypothetical protein
MGTSWEQNRVEEINKKAQISGVIDQEIEYVRGDRKSKKLTTDDLARHLQAVVRDSGNAHPRDDG